MKRIFLACIVLAALLWVHPIAGILCAIVFAFLYFPLYYEIIITGIIADSIYQSFFYISTFHIPLYTLITTIVFISSWYIQKRINIYA